eukprot:6290497-Karenia_brevis.AAC.1
MWIDNHGNQVDLKEVPPVRVKSMVDKASAAVLWNKLADSSPELEDLRQGVWLQPCRQVVLASDRVRGGCARSIMVGGQWPQQRLFDKGYVDSELCQACQEGPGTLKHRHLHCPVFHPQRRQHLDPEVFDAAVQQLGGDIFWERALYPISHLPYIPPVGVEERRWMGDEPLAAFTNDVFLDGSGHNYFWLPSLNRAGWSAAQVDQGKLVGAMFGTLPGEEQTVPRAELYALRAVLPWVITPVVIWMDHKNHVDAIKKGRAWCTSPHRPHADLWRKIWNIIDDIGGL